MDTRSVPETRYERALRLAHEHEDRIWRVAPFTWEVPSCSGSDLYMVRTDGEGSCDCPDTAKVCKHMYAVELIASRRRRAGRLLTQAS